MNPTDAQRVWGKEFLPDVELIERVLVHLDLGPESRILDVGTGWGIMAILLALHGHEVITGEPEKDETRGHVEKYAGHDHDWPEYGNWRQSAEILGVVHKIRYQHLNAETLPFPSSSFDGVFLYDTLQHIQHIQDRDTALQECLRVTKPEGILCIIETNERGIAHYGERVDPRALLGSASIPVEVIRGEFSDAFLLRAA